MSGCWRCCVTTSAVPFRFWQTRKKKNRPSPTKVGVQSTVRRAGPRGGWAGPAFSRGGRPDDGPAPADIAFLASTRRDLRRCALHRGELRLLTKD